MINKNLVQAYTSKNTSLNQVPSTGKLIATMEGIKTVLDFGCGKYDKFKEFCNDLNINFYGYDKYSKEDDHNSEALTCKPDIINCSNVFNVIMEDEILEDVLQHMKSYNCKILIKIYEGDKTGQGKQSKPDCYQRNEKAKEYLKFISKYFSNVKVKGDIITIEKED